MEKKSNHKGRGGKSEEVVLVEEDIISETPASGADDGGADRGFRGIGAALGGGLFGGERKDRFLPISILVAAVLISGSVVFSTLYRPGAGAPSATTTAAIMTLGPRDAILGNQNAPVTLIEYGDYQCPFCTRFFTQTQPSIVSDYINSGKVRMVFRNFPFLGPESDAAAAAAECAEDQNQFWPYHNALYQAKANDEAKGGGENDGTMNRTLFLKLAQQVGLNVPTFTNCIDSNKYTTAVSQERQTAAAVGVDSTPTFFVNGTKILGAQPYSAFQAAIDTALKG